MFSLQDAKFACVTIPYWDWGEWQFYCNADPLGCKSYDDMPAKLTREVRRDRLCPFVAITVPICRLPVRLFRLPVPLFRLPIPLFRHLRP